MPWTASRSRDREGRGSGPQRWRWRAGDAGAAHPGTVLQPRAARRTPGNAAGRTGGLPGPQRGGLEQDGQGAWAGKRCRSLAGQAGIWDAVWPFESFRCGRCDAWASCADRWVLRRSLPPAATCRRAALGPRPASCRQRCITSNTRAWSPRALPRRLFSAG